MPSLRRIIQDATGENLNLCRTCNVCKVPGTEEEVDVPLGSMIQMIMYNDEEVFTTRTLWSDTILAQSRYACRKGINLQAVLQALREEAKRRDA